MNPSSSSLEIWRNKCSNSTMTCKLKCHSLSYSVWKNASPSYQQLSTTQSIFKSKKMCIQEKPSSHTLNKNPTAYRNLSRVFRFRFCARGRWPSACDHVIERQRTQQKHLLFLPPKHFTPFWWVQTEYTPMPLAEKKSAKHYPYSGYLNLVAIATTAFFVY